MTKTNKSRLTVPRSRKDILAALQDPATPARVVDAIISRQGCRAAVVRILRDPATPQQAIDALINAKRSQMREAMLDALFLLGGMPIATDTYKRTMGAADDTFALERACYSLTPRKGLPEPGAGDQLVMAGHEVMLSQWFRKPLSITDIELARAFFNTASNLRIFPNRLWDKIVSENSEGDRVHLPITVWGFPGGQSFLKGVPCMAFEGVGGAVSLIEPQTCRYFAPIIQATKARLMRQSTSRDAEFGMRAAPDDLMSISLQLARYVGSGGTARLTSNDLVHFLFPELADSIGTIGHELMCSHQSFDKTLAAAEFEAMDNFVKRMGTASLLCDLVDATTIGLENALEVIRVNPEATRVGIRIDSGAIAQQCVLYYQRMKAMGVEARTIVFEDEVTPELITKVYDHFREATGVEPTMLFPGAGGYWWKIHRDMVSMAFKRTMTGDNPNVKFSNSPGKESLGGNLRVYGKDDTLIIADASEEIDGEPLFVKLVDEGRIVYNEAFEEQAQRAERTWGRYTKVELSPLVQAYRTRFNAMRDAEVAAARERFRAAGLSIEAA